MKVFYRPEQSAVGTTYFSPSPRKPALVVERWKNHETYEEVSFEPVTRKQLYLVHSKNYVDGVFDGTSNNGFGDRSPEIIRVLPYVAGSMVAATLHALKTGETSFSPTSGAHHAGYNYGGGFCTFNFLALAAAEARMAGAKKVGILDCDMHYGDGTADIIRTIGMFFVKHHSFGKNVINSYDAAVWLDMLPARLEQFLPGLDVLIYNAGADSHVNDPLGGLMTTGQLRQRDEHVFNYAAKLGVPVAVSLAGGYQNPIDPVLEIHDHTFKEAAKYDYLKDR